MPLGKEPARGLCRQVALSWYDRKTSRVRDLPCGDTRIYLDLEIRRVYCTRCVNVKQEKLEWLADNPFYTKRFVLFVRRRCRTMTIKDVVKAGPENDQGPR